MHRAEFSRLLAAAMQIGGMYAAGYQRGLRRLFHGEAFGSHSDHEKWMRVGRPELVMDEPSRYTHEVSRMELGRGYRDGFSGAEPSEPLPHENRMATLHAACLAELEK